MAMKGWMGLALMASGQAVAGGSLTVGGLLDSEQGSAVDADVRWSPNDAWSVGAGVGHGKSQLTGSSFSGTSLRASTDLYLNGFNAGVALQRWKDSNQITTRSTRGQIGWMAQGGLAVAGIIDDRNMAIRYTTRPVLGQVRQAEIQFDGTGYGAEISWIGRQWNFGAHYLDYDYGRSVDRARAALNSPNTERFPRLQLLAASVVTRAAAAPDREAGFTVGREFVRSALQGEWLLLRDALTAEQTHSLSLTHTRRFAQHLELNTTVGLSDGDASDSLAYGGLSLTWRN